MYLYLARVTLAILLMKSIVTSAQAEVTPRFVQTAKAITESEVLGVETDQDLLKRHRSNQTELLRHLRTTLAKSGVKAFLQERDRFRRELEATVPRQTYYWIRKIDSEFIETYLRSIVDVWQEFSENHPAQILRHKFIKALACEKKDDDGNECLSIAWMQDFLYRDYSKYGRGVYHSDKKKITLKILPPEELFLPLVHELSHHFDSDLQVWRHGMVDLQAKVNEFQFLPMHEWTFPERMMFGRYWFLRTRYRYYKEAIPRLNTCLTFVEVVRRWDYAVSEVDRERYQRVTKGDVSCAELTLMELAEELGVPPAFWDTGKEQRRWVDEFEKL